VSEWGKIETTKVVDLPNADNITSFQQPNNTPSNPKSANVLVVDDEPLIRELFCELLTREGHTVTALGSSREALRQFHRDKYDIAYIDLGMPEISGWQVASEIRRSESETMLVMVTGWGSDLDDEKIAESGIDLVIAKPFQICEIRNSIAQAIEMQNRQPLKQAVSS